MDTRRSAGVQDEAFTHSTRRRTVTLEAQLVAEEDTARVAQQIDEESHQSLLRQLGQVTHAEIMEEDGSRPARRYRVLLCAALVVIVVLTIIIASVFGTRTLTLAVVPVTGPTMSPTQAAPTVNNDDNNNNNNNKLYLYPATVVHKVAGTGVECGCV